VGDFKGDGRADLAVTDSHSVWVLFSNGNGTFAPPVNVHAPIILGGYINRLTVGDFTGDGRQDLALSLLGPPTRYGIGGAVNVMLSGADGTFGTPIPVYPTDATLGLAVGVFNNEGLLDLVVCPTGPVDRTPGVLLLLNASKAPVYGPGHEGIGVFDPVTATWYLRDTARPGDPTLTPFHYGLPGWKPVVGDWNGDGVTTIGVVDPTTAVWYLRNENSPGFPDVAAPFAYGLPGWIPVAGDWSRTGHAGIGMFDPSTATWYLRNEAGPGYPDAGVFRYGGAGWLPVVGDWDGNGTTTLGVVDPATMTWYLRNENSAGAPDIAPFAYGAPGWLPVVGDWTGSGKTTIGVVVPDHEGWYLRTSNSAGPWDVMPFYYGLPGWTPLAGAWIWPGRPMPTVSHLGKTSPGEDALASFLAPGPGPAAALDAVFAQAVA
jgi:hypothetical protein